MFIFRAVGEEVVLMPFSIHREIRLQKRQLEV
jgi:hypothetical protein